MYMKCTKYKQETYIASIKSEKKSLHGLTFIIKVENDDRKNMKKRRKCSKRKHNAVNLFGIRANGEAINANLLKFKNNGSQPEKNNYYDKAPSKDKDQPGKNVCLFGLRLVVLSGRFPGFDKY